MTPRGISSESCLSYICSWTLPPIVYRLIGSWLLVGWYFWYVDPISGWIFVWIRLTLFVSAGGKTQVQPDYLPPLDRRRMLRRRTAFYLQPPQLPGGILGILLQISVLLFSIILLLATLPSQAVVAPRAQVALENLRYEYLDPLLHSVGIWQGPWHLYKIESFSEVSHFQAFVQLDNGEVVDRRSPTWRAQEWWERKQSTRLLKFFSKFASSKETWVSYCEHLTKEANDSVTGIQLIRLVSVFVLYQKASCRCNLRSF